MADIDGLLGCHGVVSRGELAAAGIEDARIREMARSDALRRLRSGWFVGPHADPRRIAYRSLVVIPEVGRVDFLAGRRLIVEADSRAHHAGDGIERDRDRDLAAHRLGYLPFRASYQQVFCRFEAVAAALDAVISRGEHLRPAEIDV